MKLYQFYDPEWPHDDVNQMASGRWNRQIECAFINFESGHVVFKDDGHMIVLALRNGRVDDLVPVEERIDTGTRQCGVMSDPLPGGSRRDICTYSEHTKFSPHSWQFGVDRA
jgi:hypothetical protein